MSTTGAKRRKDVGEEANRCIFCHLWFPWYSLTRHYHEDHPEDYRKALELARSVTPLQKAQTT